MTARQLKCPRCRTPFGSPDPKTQSRICFKCDFVARGTQEVHLLLQASGKEIAKDYLRLGLTDTLYKWGISASALYRLPEVRELKGKYRKLIHKEHNITTIPQEQGNGHLPQLPIFSNDWASEVQLKWLSLYEIILTKKREEKSIN